MERGGQRRFLVVRRGRPPSSQPSGRRDASASRTRTRSPNKASRSHERARLLAGFAATTSSPSPCLARSFGRPRLSRRAQGRLLFSVHTFDISREPAIVRRFAARWTASDFCRKMSTSRPFARVLLPGGPSTPPHLISRTRARGSEGFASCLVRSDEQDSNHQLASLFRGVAGTTPEGLRELP